MRFADDFIAGFEHHADAQQFWTDLRDPFARFGLNLHEDKTRLIEFRRHAAQQRRIRSLGKPVTFDFLGCTSVGRPEPAFRALAAAALGHSERSLVISVPFEPLTYW